MDIKEKIGSALKVIREKKQLTQDELAKLSQIDRTFISHVEKGRRNVSVETLDKLLKGLDISYKDFYKQSFFIY